MATDLGPLLKAAYPRVVATLVRVLGDMDRASDATQDALVKALDVWQREGVPDNPVAWLVTVGRNRAVDVLRRDSRVVSLDQRITLVPEDDTFAEPDAALLDWAQVDDDLLRLMFTCCHPLLKPPAQVALVLKVLLGFSTEEIARGLLASPASVEKRITRAKRSLREAGVAYEVPRVVDIPARLDAVLQAIYLVFNEGYTRIQDANLMRSSLIDVALRLGRITSRLFRRDGEPRSLLALMLLTTARLPARVDAQGVFVPLEAQDRALWDAAMIQEGVALIDAVYVARHRPGAYQIQAAISAIHSQAASAASTDWAQIVALYGKLAEYDPSPVVPVNQAVARCFCGEPKRALQQLLDPAVAQPLASYQPYYAALGFVYQHLGDHLAALAPLERALQLAGSPAQRRYLQRQLDALQ